MSPREEDGAGKDGGGLRAFWSGTLSFGLVSVPVDLFPAVRSQRASLRMLSASGTPLSRRYFDPGTGEALSGEDLVRGYPLGDDRFVPLTDEELEAAAPEQSRDIDLRRFVPVDQLDPALFQRAYYLTPAGETTKAYRLLTAAMEKTGKAGIATFVMRGIEYLVAIVAEGGILRAETLRFADELRTPADVGLPDPKEPPAREVKRTREAIRRLAKGALDEDELADVWSEELRRLAERKKRKGEDLVEAPPGSVDEADDDRVIDLLEVLRRSLAADAPRGGGDELSSMTKEQLYERAKERDVPGRSSMTKQELIRALRGAA